MNRLHTSVASLALCLFTATASAQTPFTVGSVTAAPGTVASGSLTIAPRGGDTGTEIPFSIVHGATAGPVLALVAGTHGMEYVPILALQKMRTTIDPKTLKGTVIMIHVANMPSFLGRTIYYSPADGKNLNRVFPGKADGTLSERIAEAITREVITRATHVVDLHCGDGNESLAPYSYWITTGPAGIPDQGKAMALAFGLNTIVVDGSRPTDAAASVYLSNTAITRGKPALTTETGGMAVVDSASIALVENGVRGLMRHLKMQATGPAPAAAPNLLAKTQVITSNSTGILRALVQKGQVVAMGAKIAQITDFHGKVLEEITAPFAGQVLYVVATPPIKKGEPVAMLGSK
jgi:predicted deacylase